jgi:hypothetical protein
MAPRDMSFQAVQPPNDGAKLSRLLASLAIVALLGGLFIPIPGRFSAPWAAALEDLTHVPLIAALAWLLRRVATIGVTVAAGISLGAAIVVEPLQTIVERSASLRDALLGASGIFIFLGWQMSMTLPTAWGRIVARLASVAIGVAWPLGAAWPNFSDAATAWSSFPTLADFSSPRQSRRWTMEGCRLSCEHDDQGNSVGVLTCEPVGGQRSSMTLFPVRRNWSRRHLLRVDFTVETAPLLITFSVRDGRRVASPRRRFDLNDVYLRGRHVVEIDLDQIARGSVAIALVNVTAVQSFHVIVNGESPLRVVRLHRIWLEYTD